MAKLYKKAHDWHKQEAARYLHLLKKVSMKLVEDEDQQLMPLPWGVSQEMKQMLQDKKDQL